MSYVPPDPAEVEAAGQTLLTAFARRVAERANPTARPPGHSPSDIHHRVYAALHTLHGRLPRLYSAVSVLCLFLKDHSWKVPQLVPQLLLKPSAAVRAVNVLRKLGLVERRGYTSDTYYWLTGAGEQFLLETLPPPPAPEAPAPPAAPAPGPDPAPLLP